MCVGVHPISKVLLQVSRRRSNVGLPDGLLHAAAVHEHVLLSGMTVVVAKHLCIDANTQIPMCVYRKEAERRRSVGCITHGFNVFNKLVPK